MASRIRPTPLLLPSPDEVARQGAAHVAALLRAAPANRPLALALSGGSTPAPLYRRLATLDVPWERLHVFWVDERFVPPTDARSNERLVREALLEAVPVPAAHVHPVPTDAATPGEAADRYDARLREVLGADGGFTVAILGAGDDGHTASLFPGQPLDHPGRFAVHTRAPATSPVTDRITVTRALLAQSEHVVFLVTGETKAPIVEASLFAPETPPRYPAGAITARQSVAWIMDANAAGAHGVALCRP